MVQEIRETYESPTVPPAKCLNCGHMVALHYCPRCGQHIKDHNHGIWQFVLEFLDDFIRIDSKFLRTFVPLLFRPGYLTSQWVAGKRVRYITPLKLYVSLSAICFLVVSLTTHPQMMNIDSSDPKSLEMANQQIEKEAGKSTSAFQRTMLKAASKFTVGGAEGAANKREFEELFMGRLSTANLILLPIFALLFKLLYIRRSRYYVEHLVFALHYYAFFSFGATLIMLASYLGAWSALIDVPVVIWMIIYLPVAMFLNYRQGFFKTMFKCWIFASIYVIVVAVVLSGMLLLAMYQTGSKTLHIGKNSAAPVKSPAILDFQP